MFALLQPKHHGSTPRGTPRNFRPNRVEVLKKWLSAYKSCNISETRQDYYWGKLSNQGYYWSRIGNHTRAFDWCPNQWPWMALKGRYSKHVRLSELTVKIWIKIDLYCRRKRCSPMTLVSADIRFVPIFDGVHWREGVKRQWGNRKH